MALNCIVVATNGIIPSPISDYLQSARFFEVVGVYLDVEQARQNSAELSVHYYLMDIQTAQANLANMLSSGSNGPKVLIFSAEAVFFLENLRAGVDSLLIQQSPNAEQPSQKDLKLKQEVVNLEFASTTTHELSQLMNGPFNLSVQADAVQITTKQVPSSTDSIFVRSESRIARIRLDELLVVEAQKDYVIFHTPTEQFRVLNSMKRIQSQLSSEHFFRIHRSFIVRMDKIHTIQADEVQLDHYPNAVPIGPSFKTKLMKKLQLL